MSNIPTWPALFTQWAPAYTSNGGAFPQAQYVDLSNRVMGSMGIKTGKQYELDSAQAGELTAQLRNDDQALDPTNTAGPFGGSVLPYQPFTVTAQYPQSPNLLTPYQATCAGATSGSAVPVSAGVWSGTDSTNGSVVTISSHLAFRFVVPVTSGAENFIMSIQGFPVAGGQEYSFTSTVLNATNTYTPAVQIAFAWFNSDSPTAVQQWNYGPVVNLTYNTAFTISASCTAPVWASGLAVGIVTGSTVTTQWVCNTYNNQAQQGPATAFTAPGTWYPLFSGFVERWPTKWNEAGQYGTIGATVVDAMALLSQGQLDDPMTEEIQSAGSTYLYRLDDPSTADQAYESTNRFPSVFPSGVNSPGALTWGNSIDATNPTGVFTAGGVNPTVVDITPSANGTMYLNMNTAGILGPQTSTFTRMVAFRWEGTVTASNSAIWLWGAGDTSGVNMCSMLLLPNGTNNTAGASLAFYLQAGGLLFNPSGVNLLDGNWHLVGFGTNSSQTILFVDGQYSLSTGTFGFPPDITYDCVGYSGNISSPYATNYFFNGQLAYVTEFPSLLTQTQVQNIYGAWYDACSGETAGARYSRILRYAGYTGASNVGSGVLSNSLGPATDLAGSDALTCLENVVATENGIHYVSSNGTLTFTGRGFRYTTPTPVMTLGENQAGGEFPYEDLQLDYDTTHLANDVTVTNNSSSQDFYATNPASQLAYFDRTLTKTINVTNANECVAAAQFLAWRYGQPLTRVSSVTLNPAAQSGLWAACLTLDVNQCIQINRRPPGGNVISLLLWIEAKQWTLGADGQAKLVLQCSPVLPAPIGQFTVFQAKLAVQAAAGQPTITLTNATDQVNPLNASLYPGQQFEIHSVSGGATFETLTIQSVQATGKNWTTGTVTFTTNLALTHTASTVCSELSPNSPGNLNLYNNNAVFGTAAFAY